ncbi:MAG: sensor histidine kinase [Acidobacteriaceae bacterium]
MRTLTYYRESAQPIKVNLKQVTEDVLILERAHIASAKVSVITKFVGHDPIITAHPGEIRQILINLIENSLAALSPDGRLYISVRPSLKLPSQQPGYSLCVADSGRGIPRALTPKLFTPFFTTKGPNGTGLGLWIIRQIVEKQGGDLRIRSREGVGTVASILASRARKSWRRTNDAGKIAISRFCRPNQSAEIAPPPRGANEALPWLARIPCFHLSSPPNYIVGMVGPADFESLNFPLNTGEAKPRHPEDGGLGVQS